MIIKNIYITFVLLSAIIYTCTARTFHPDSFSFDDNNAGTADLDNAIDKYYATDSVVVGDDGPPPHTEYAQMARYLVHRSDWTSMGTNSLEFPGFPMVNIISMADSPKNEKSTGNIYFYLTDLDYTGQDLKQDNKLTIMLSQDQDLSCKKANMDSMEPTCARIMMTGSIKKVCARVGVVLSKKGIHWHWKLWNALLKGSYVGLWLEFIQVDIQVVIIQVVIIHVVIQSSFSQ